MSMVIQALDLTKKYGEILAVDRLNLEIPEGEVFGLLGPNGAGKTTTILMLLGLTEPTAGKARVCGLDPTRQALAVKQVAGYLPDSVGFYDELSGRQNLLYTAALNAIPRAEAAERAGELLPRVGLAAAADRQVGTYSRGMRQRLGLADVLIKQPRVVILDEPTLGIDPEGVQELLDLIVRLSRQEQITVLLSSHQLHQVQQICDRVGIFVQGRMLACGRIDDLAGQIMAGQPLQIEVGIAGAGSGLIPALQRVDGVTSITEEGGTLLLICGHDVRAGIAAVIHGQGAALTHLRLRGRSLDDIYRRYFEGVQTGAGAELARPVP